MKVIAIIPARGGSKRLPRKNIYPIWGKPMLYWAIKACKESQYNIEPWVSTDDDEIASVAAAMGARIHERSAGLGGGHIYKQAVVREAGRLILEERKDRGLEKPDVWISLQPNSPEVKGMNLDMAIALLMRNDRDEIFSVDRDFMQNAAFRVFRGDYIFQKDLSTNCGVYVCDLMDVHIKEDVEFLEEHFDREE